MSGFVADNDEPGDETVAATFITRSGKVLTDEDIELLADGFDPPSILNDPQVLSDTADYVQAAVPDMEITPELTRSILIDPLTPLARPERRDEWLRIQKALIGDIGLDAYLEGLLHVVEFPTQLGYRLSYDIRVSATDDLHVVEGERRLL